MSADLSLGETSLLIDECNKRGLLRNQAAYTLATAFWESAHTMEPVREAFWLSEQWRRENLRYYPWYGRGFVQLTWESNYQAMGARLGLDLTTDPDKVMEPNISAQILVVGMQEGIFTGKKLDDYITLKSSNYRGARRIVNGTDKANAIAEIAEDYEAALLAIGYGVEPVVQVANERKDGTPARASKAQSKTLWGQATQWAGTSGLGLLAFYQAQDETVKLGIAAISCAAIIAGAVVFKDRLRKWAEGIR